jgi:hypothetical protein
MFRATPAFPVAEGAVVVHPARPDPEDLATAAASARPRTMPHPDRTVGPSTPGRPRWATAAALAMALALGGCATLGAVDSDVASYSQWPADRKPGTYAFERLPSQQARPQEQAALEAAARGALEKAGFTPATDPASAEVVVQLGSRTTRLDAWPPQDRWLWGPVGWVGHPWRTRSWAASASFGWNDLPRYEREVAVLIRDRRSGQPLYETRAANDGTTAPPPEVLGAMFDAALKDFPMAAVNPRRVRVELPR